MAWGTAFLDPLELLPGVLRVPRGVKDGYGGGGQDLGGIEDDLRTAPGFPVSNESCVLAVQSMIVPDVHVSGLEALRDLSTDQDQPDSAVKLSGVRAR